MLSWTLSCTTINLYNTIHANTRGHKLSRGGIELTQAVKEQNSLTITVDAAAQMLGIARHTAYKACHTGELPIIRIGKRFLVSRVALERMLAGKDEDGNS